MLNRPFSFDHTMRELFEYPDPTVPYVVWRGDFGTLPDKALLCHWHDEFEYGVLLSGELDYAIDGQHIRLKQGDAVFINANTMHMATQAGQETVILFTVSFLPSLFPGGYTGTMFQKYFQPILQSSLKGFPIGHTSSEGEQIVQLLHEIYRLDSEQAEDYELLCSGSISRLWSLTLRYIKMLQQNWNPSQQECSSENRAKDILTYIHEHYAEDICIEDIARHTGISRSECFRSFQRYTGKSPNAYLTEYRLSHAATLLAETSKSVTQVATECGFSSSSYFCKIFKRNYTVTPARFKDHCRHTE